MYVEIIGLGLYLRVREASDDVMRSKLRALGTDRLVQMNGALALM